MNIILLCFSHSEKDASDGVGRNTMLSGIRIKPMHLGGLLSCRTLSPSCITESF